MFGSMMLASSASAMIKQTFQTAGTYSLIVPAGITHLTCKVWGAGGGSGYTDIHQGGLGGAGAFESSTIVVSPGETLTFIVGAGGGTGAYWFSNTGYGGGGGGISSINRGGTVLVAASGGGGGGGANSASNGGAGGVGGSNGGSGGVSGWGSGGGGNGGGPSVGDTLMIGSGGVAPNKTDPDYVAGHGNSGFPGLIVVL